LELFKRQIEALIAIQKGTHPAATLLEVETRLRHRKWSKIYYQEADPDLLRMVPAQAKTILSIGCGSGALEEKLIERGARLTALPLDSVIGAVAERLGIEMIYGTLEEGLRRLHGRRFDCVLIVDVLHLRPDFQRLLEQCAELVAPGGALVVQSPNFNYLPILTKRVLRLGEMRKLRNFSQGRVCPVEMRRIARRLRRCGFQVSSRRWFNRPHFNHAPPRNYFGIRKYLGRLMAEDWVLVACQRNGNGRGQCGAGVTSRD
jgi:SAM-dependent methyltransferase